MSPVAAAAMSLSTTSAGPRQQPGQDGGRILVVKILGQHGGAGDRLDRREIDADHDALAALGLDPLDGDLGPAAGRGAEIDDAARPALRKRNWSSICSSLKAARER